MNSSNAVTRELLKETIRIALFSQGVSLDGAWHGAEELIQCATPKVVRGWLAAYSDRDWIFSHLHTLVDDAAHGHWTVKFTYERLVFERREQQLAYPSLSTFRRRVRIERQLANTMERILDLEAKRNRARERERARMPDASDFITRILDAAEAEGFHVIRRIGS
ncbi:hypothetical protein CO661_00440 [Sinorhizobium fredii]|uniref:Uncharacterized protein n=1 Tax=Rhizobium fredii TaxID=380 RepID=A0A2A6M6I8_RHIFR|nr:hypothetical protein CO661_00440 [Sinorhizobium fredii]